LYWKDSNWFPKWWEEIKSDIPDNLVAQLCVCVPSMGSDLQRCVKDGQVVHWSSVRSCWEIFPFTTNNIVEVSYGKYFCDRFPIIDVLYQCDICEEYFIDRDAPEDVPSVIRLARCGYNIRKINEQFHTNYARMYYCAECI